MELREGSVLRKPHGISYYRLYTIRNDADINNYSPLVSMAWSANADVNPCTGLKAMVEYISKYVTKGEEKTMGYRDMMTKLLPSVNASMPLLSAVRKMMNQLIGERDWSAQEVCHLLLNMPLQQGSCSVITVDVRPEDSQNQAYRFTGHEDDDAQKGKSWLQKYKERPDDLSQTTYFDFLLRWYIYADEYKERQQNRVINYFPEYEDQTSDEFARVKLMLHHPFRENDDRPRRCEYAGGFHHAR